MTNFNHRGKQLHRRLMNLSKADPTLPDRIIKNLMNRPWLGVGVDPSLEFLKDLEEPSIDHVIAIGLALGYWPNWLLFGETDVLLPTADFYELLVCSISKLDPEETGETMKWILDQLNVDHITTRREVEHWFSARKGPRIDIVGRLESVLNLRKGSIEPNPVGKLRKLEPYEVLELANPDGDGTLRYPRGNAPVPGTPFVPIHHKLKMRVNSQRTTRVLEEASGLEVSSALMAKWIRGELIPSNLEIRILNLAPQVPEEEIDRYRMELELGMKVLASADAIMKSRKRLLLDFKERVAAALDASGVCALSSPKSSRISALKAMGYEDMPPWTKSDENPDDLDIERLTRATGVSRYWFTHGIASPHSVLG